MPYYFPNEMDTHLGLANPHQSIQQVAGEFMKAGVVTKPEGSGPPLHSHPNEEQFTYILTGELHYILGEEERIVKAGDMIHIPRNTKHRSRAINGEATFFTVKSPPGNTGHLDEDYNKADDAEEREATFPGTKKG